jgi:hypothetical protein
MRFDVDAKDFAGRIQRGEGGAVVFGHQTRVARRIRSQDR